MFNMIIVSGIVILIVLLSAYLVHDSEMLKKLKEGAKKKIGKAKTEVVPTRRELKIVNGPVVRVKAPGETNYTPHELTKDVVKIGRSSRSDIVLDDDTVENTHAEIRKMMKGNDVFYELINFSKINPVDVLDKETCKYENFLGYKKGIILTDNEVFYIGNTKFLFTKPVSHHEATVTERLIVEKGDTDCTDVLPQDSGNVKEERKVSESPQKKDPQKRDPQKKDPQKRDPQKKDSHKKNAQKKDAQRNNKARKVIKQTTVVPK